MSRIRQGQRMRPSQRGGEEHSGVDRLQSGTAAHQRHQHLERGAGCAGDGKAWADGQVDQDREHLCKGRVHPPGQRAQTSGVCYRSHTRDGQTDGTDRQSGKGRPEVCPRLCAQMGREN